MMELSIFTYEGDLSIRTLLYAILALLAFVSLMVKTLGRNPTHVKFASLLKGPNPIPIFGNSLQYLAAGTEAPTKLMPFWKEKYGSIYRLWFGNDLYVVISDVDYLKDIFDNRKIMFHGPKSDELWKFLSNDDNAAEVDVWKSLKSMHSHFSPIAVKALVPKINNRISQLTDDLQKKSGCEFDVRDIIFDTVFDIFTSTQYDYVMDSPTKERFDIRSKAKKVMAIVIGLPLLFPGTSSKFARYLIRYILARPLKNSYYYYVQMITSGKISSIRNQMEKSINLEQPKLSYLWTLLQRNDSGLDTGNVKVKNKKHKTDPTGALVFSAALTTDPRISFTLLMIAMHSSVQDKLYKEIYEVFGDDQRQASYEDIERLSYMDQVFSETIRRNIRSFFYRYVTEDTQIGSYTFPKGTYVIVDMTGVHADEKLYPRPLEFNPDNFSEEMVAKRSSFSFIGFSAGKRRCLGETFARAEMKLILVAILRKFILRTSLRMDDMKYKFTSDCESAVGYPISFVPRN